MAVAGLNHPHALSTPQTSPASRDEAVLTLQEWTAQQPQQAARRVRPQESSDAQADSSSLPNLDLGLYHHGHHFQQQTIHSNNLTAPSPGHLSHPDLLSPDLWWQHFGSISPAIDNTTGTPFSSAHNSALAQDLMTFGQTWTDSGAGFAAGPSLNDYDFSFDPALIDALPDSIPDFWLVPPSANTTDNPQDQQQQEQQQQQQQLESLTLNPPPQPSSSTFIPTTTTGTTEPRSHASSPASDSPGGNSRSGPGRASKRDAEDPDVVVKRQRNTIAARKYRQKRLDRIQELEDALKAVTGERDELRLRLARQEAETAALREMMQMKSGKGNSE